MSKILKSIAGILIISTSINLAATPATAESKTSQCKRFHQANVALSNQIPHASSENVDQNRRAEAERISLGLKTGLKAFKLKKLSDPKIRSFQQATLKTLVQFDNDLMKFIESTEHEGLAEMSQKARKMKMNIPALESIGDQTNAYCGRPK
jgi:hypothetical protein